MVSILDQLRSEDIFSVVEFSSNVKVNALNSFINKFQLNVILSSTFLGVGFEKEL